MYLEHFGFAVEPFELAPNAEFLYLSRAHKKAFTYLNYALWNKDTFTMLTGEIGSGKTILLQHLLKIMPSTAKVVTIYQTQLTPYELLYAIAEGLDLVLEENVPKPKLFKAINQYISASSKNVVIIIDEAQSFSRETMEELRLLAGIDIINAKSNINVVLCGQPELKGLVEGGNLEQLNQRIKLRFHLTPLSYEETREYVTFRVIKAGQKLEIFTLDAIKKIYDITNGLPRLINVLADTALTCGYADGFYAISSKQIDEAKHELGWDANPPQLAFKENGAQQKVVNIQDVAPRFATGELATVEQSINRIEQHLADIASSLRLLVEVNDLQKNHKFKL
jgi:type II secretory pathway predicted ATPase ExeA